MIREEYLLSVITALRPYFSEKGYLIPLNVRVSIGLPHHKAFAAKGRVVGQCWSDTETSDTTFEIFVSPTLSDTTDIIGTLAHELCHACVGTEAKHGKPFIRCAHTVGLEGKPTSTTPGPQLLEWIGSFVASHGQYRGGALSPTLKTKILKTYQLKVTCPTCGYTCRTTKKWLDAAGPPLCPTHTSPMVLEEKISLDNPDPPCYLPPDPASPSPDPLADIPSSLRRDPQ